MKQRERERVDMFGGYLGEEDDFVLDVLKAFCKTLGMARIRALPPPCLIFGALRERERGGKENGREAAFAVGAPQGCAEPPPPGGGLKNAPLARQVARKPPGAPLRGAPKRVKKRV